MLPCDDPKEDVEIAYLNITNQINTYQESGSGWCLYKLCSLQLNILKYNPLQASSFISLPQRIKDKQGCVNIQNSDQKCFLWSILAHFHPIPNFYQSPRMFKGPNCILEFLDSLKQDVAQLKEILRHPIEMDLSPEEEIAFNAAKVCHICDKPETDIDPFVRNHDHLSGKFLGSSHNSCNLNYGIKATEKIPIFFHNLKNFDAHLILSNVDPEKHGRVTCIPKNMEKYVSFTIGDVVFKDSFGFINKSLASLVDSLKPEDLKMTKQYLEENEIETCDSFIPSKRIKIDNSKSNIEKPVPIVELPESDYRRNPHRKPILNEEQRQNVDKKFELLQRKGIFPYEYIDNYEKLNEGLPPIDCFYDTLKEEMPEEKDYEFAKQIWRTFNMETMWNYHDLYLMTDVHLLADVLISFREMCLEYYKIDPFHSYTTPGFSWQIALRMSDVKLKLLSDKDLYLFFEAGKRGGFSVINHRYAKCNIEDSDNYDPSLPRQELVYLDANNLYGNSLSQPLPVDEFERVDTPITDILKTKDDAYHGYMLEVDFEYPKELHNEHNDLPLAPEKQIISYDMLSPYQKEIVGDRTKNTIKKLIASLGDKKNYIVHYRVLKKYVELGLKVSRVHQIIRFKQTPWLKKFIDFNTQKRAEADSDFKKDFFKLLNNAVFGKTMENVREHRHLDLVKTAEKAQKLCSKPTFRGYKIFHDNLIAIERYKSVVNLNKPIYTGVTVLDLSKLHMYQFHYEFIKKEYPGDKSLLTFSDTDSLLYVLQTNDIYKDMLNHHNLFDFSNYPDEHKMFNRLDKKMIGYLKKKNKKVIGKFKDELEGKTLLEFIGLRAKVYSFIYEDDDKNVEVQKCKGMKKSVVRKKINHDHYKRCLFEGTPHYEEMNVFKAKKHQISAVTQRKLALSQFDDKRYILNDGITSLAYGHYKIEEKT